MAAQARKKRSSKKNQKLTLKEFRAWLQGVEELQPDEWCPNAEQWKKIREKIDKIVDEEPQQGVNYGQPPQHGGTAAPMHPSQYGAAFEEPVQPGPSAPVTPTGPPMGGSGLEEAAAFAPKKQPGPSMDIGGSDGMPGAGAPGTSSEGPRIRTPDIDTSDGSYGSSFE